MTALTRACALHAEHLGCEDAGTASDLATSVSQNRSVVRVPDFATDEEVTLLRTEGEGAAAAQGQNLLSSSSTRFRIEIFGRSLSSGVALVSLSLAVQTLADTLVRRAIVLVQTKLPALAEAFGLSACTAKTELDFSEGEPAINVYRGPGGDFKPHQDARALTLLMPLSTHGVDYEGGGTAFYAPGVRPADAIRGAATPTTVLRPRAGTALLWGGTLTHAGAEVVAGRRLVFVASFSPIDAGSRC